MAFAPFDLSGKVALVTGGNNGLGLGFATGIAKAGGDVVIWGRRAEKNEEAAAERAAGCGCRPTTSCSRTATRTRPRARSSTWRR